MPKIQSIRSDYKRTISEQSIIEDIALEVLGTHHGIYFYPIPFLDGYFSFSWTTLGWYWKDKETRPMLLRRWKRAILTSIENPRKRKS